MTILIAVLACAALFALAFWMPQRSACNGSSCGACGAACSQLLETDDETIR
jgi:ferredoxin